MGRNSETLGLFQRLPDELLIILFRKFLKRNDLLSLRVVSRAFQNFIDANFFRLPDLILDELDDLQGLHDYYYQKQNQNGCCLMVKCTIQLEFDGLILMPHMLEQVQNEPRRIYHVKTKLLAIKFDYDSGFIGGFIERPVIDATATPWSDNPWAAFDDYISTTCRFTEKFKIKNVWVKGYAKPVLNKPIGIYFDSVSIPKYYRVGWDKLFCYGDGGESYNLQPVWESYHLPISDKARHELLQALVERDKKFHDINSNGIVHDLLDPDLYGVPCDTQNPSMLIDARFLFEHVEANPPVRRHIQDRRAQFEKTEGGRLRLGYHWIPCNVKISSDCKVDFPSPLPGIPAVFQAMIPMFQELGVIPKNQESTVQVVVKIQRYRIPPRTSYSGLWHREGVQERIAAVGVYYIEVDPELSGGDLKFRCANSPDSHYFRSVAGKQYLSDPAIDAKVKPKDGFAVVFSNSIPHRFRRIENQTFEPRWRTFINFFIIDPRYPLAGPQPLTYIWDRRPTEQEKERRKKVRDHFRQKPDLWYKHDWGNSGTVEFLFGHSKVAEEHVDGQPVYSLESLMDFNNEIQNLIE